MSLADREGHGAAPLEALLQRLSPITTVTLQAASSRELK
jgi:hypothetical protein